MPDNHYDLLVVVPDSAPPSHQSSRLAYEVLYGTGSASGVVVMAHDYYGWMIGAAASLPATVQHEGTLLYGS